MKRRLRHIPAFAAILCCLLAGNATAAPRKAPLPEGNGASADALTASKVFADIPLQVLELLRPSTRLDMLDYYTQADSLWKAPNALEGYCQLQEVADDYLRVRVSDVSSLEIKILPMAKYGDIVMTLYTVGDDATAKDTEIRFFDRNLNPLKEKGIFTPPSMYDFFSLAKGSGLTKKELDDLIPFQTVEYSTGSGSAPLTATFTTLTSLPEETKERLRPFLLPPLQYQWTGKSFKR